MYDFTRHRREYNMNILIGADLVPTESNAEYFVKGDIRHLFGDELVTVLNDADYRIFNLEVPLTKKASPIPKCARASPRPPPPPGTRPRPWRRIRARRNNGAGVFPGRRAAVSGKRPPLLNVLERKEAHNNE